MNTPFYNHDAEAAVLAALTIGKRDMEAYTAQLFTDDFHDPVHRRIFQAVQRLSAMGSEITLVTIDNQVKDANIMSALMDIQRIHAIDGWAIQSHIDIVRSASLRRRLYKQLDDARNKLSDPEVDSAAALDDVRQGLRDMAATRHNWVSMPDVLTAAYETVEKRQMGEIKAMPSGIPILDRRTSGFHRGELTIIGARPAVGKSALGMHIALATAAQGYRVGVVSREMTDVQYGIRILGSGTDIEPGKLRTGELDPADWAQLADSLQRHGELSVDFMFTARDVEDLRMEVQNKVDAGELDMLVIDYLQLMQTRKTFDKDYLRVGYVSKAIKDMTTDFNIPIIALAQVGRSGANSMPSLSELRGSGDIEQDADNVIFMHRPENKGDENILSGDADLIDALEENGKQYILLEVAKQRQGATGRLAVAFDPAHMRYTEIQRS